MMKDNAKIMKMLIFEANSEHIKKMFFQKMFDFGHRKLPKECIDVAVLDNTQ